MALKSACVLGAGGFLGSRTVDHLSRNTKFRITAITSSPPPKRILLADNSDRVTWLQVKSINAYFSDEIISYIQRHDLIFYFLASSRSEAQKQPQLARLINIELPAVLMDKLESNNTFIYFSSFGVYEKITISENQIKCKVKPTDVYSNQKLEVDRIITSRLKKSKSTAISIRLPNMVGFPTRNLRPENSLLFYQIVHAAKAEQHIAIKSDELKIFCPVMVLLLFFDLFYSFPFKPGLKIFEYGIPLTPTQFATYINDTLQDYRGKNCSVFSDYRSDYLISPIQGETENFLNGFDCVKNIEAWLRYEILKSFDYMSIGK